MAGNKKIYYTMRRQQITKMQLRFHWILLVRKDKKNRKYCCEKADVLPPDMRFLSSERRKIWKCRIHWLL